MFRFFRWLFGLAAFFHSSLRDEKINNDAHEQNKVWIAIVLHILYSVFFVTCFLYYFFCFPMFGTANLISLLFFPIAAFCSIVSVLCYAKLGWVRLLYWTLVLYGLTYPYLMWLKHGVYMETPAYCWNWLTLSSILTLLLLSARPALAILLLQLLTPVAGALVDHYSAHQKMDIHSLLERDVQIVVPACTLFLITLFLGQVAAHSQKQAALKHELGQTILRNVLPMAVADRLVAELAVSPEVHIAEEHAMATICFCDIVGFTQLSLSIDPSELVMTLNKVFSHFDRLCIAHGLEKIKTIGDAYMFAGFPTDHPRDSALAVVAVAMEMVRHMADFDINGTRLQIRAGANTGPLVAGVIGCTKFTYDVWGPTVNLASRLESSGLPGEIQISRPTKNLLQGFFACIFRDTLQLKGAGRHDAFLVKKAIAPLPNMPVTEGGVVGLSDISKLVQEIRRRQASFSVPDNRVRPAEDLTSNVSITHSRSSQLVSPKAEELPAAPSFSGIAVCRGSRATDMDGDIEAPRLSRALSTAATLGEKSMMFSGRMVLPGATNEGPLEPLPTNEDDDDFGLQTNSGIGWRTNKEQPAKEATPLNRPSLFPLSASPSEELALKEATSMSQSGINPSPELPSRQNSGVRRSSILMNYPFLDRDADSAADRSTKFTDTEHPHQCTEALSQSSSPAASSPLTPFYGPPPSSPLQVRGEYMPPTHSMDSIANTNFAPTFASSDTDINDAVHAQTHRPDAFRTRNLPRQLQLPTSHRSAQPVGPSTPVARGDLSSTESPMPTSYARRNSVGCVPREASSRPPDPWRERLLPPFMRSTSTTASKSAFG